jgi:hypothetical protein
VSCCPLRPPDLATPFSSPELRSCRLSSLCRHHVQTSLARQAYNLDSVRASSLVDRDTRTLFRSRTQVTVDSHSCRGSVCVSRWGSGVCGVAHARTGLEELRNSNSAPIFGGISLTYPTTRYMLRRVPCAAFTVRWTEHPSSPNSKRSLSLSGNHAQIRRLSPYRATHTVGK